jgi:predicted nucleotide-binding protein (sugar kinase/HSP70/actin superfamily)
MYEAEYRLALRNAGFDGFRVVVFDQEGGFAQSGSQAGLEMNVPFFLVLLNGLLMGDLLNALAFHIRPYESQPGSTDQVLEKCLAVCQEAFRTKGRRAVRNGVLAKLISKATGYDAAPFLDQLRSTHYIDALQQCREIIDDEIEVDYTRPKQVVKITGEFWAQTTEGDGNFGMFPFLEGEGAEVLVEPVTTYLDYIINHARTRARDRRGLIEDTELHGPRNVTRRVRLELAYRKRNLVLASAARILAREYERMRRALGASVHPLANQLELQRVGHPYYNSRSEGGEGHLEVAKNIYYMNRDLAHIVLSLKPFGCMPSTQSDGAQAAVIANFPDMIYLPIETCGEGDINAHSRVQMALGEARVKCKDEFSTAVMRTGYSLKEIRAYVDAHRALRRPLQQVPHETGVVGRAANFVLHVATLMDQDRAWSARKTRPAVRAPWSAGGTS